MSYFDIIVWRFVLTIYYGSLVYVTMYVFMVAMFLIFGVFD